MNYAKKTIDFSNELCKKKNYRLYLHYKQYTKKKNQKNSKKNP